jgi:hypothetical protein
MMIGKGSKLSNQLVPVCIHTQHIHI